MPFSARKSNSNSQKALRIRAAAEKSVGSPVFVFASSDPSFLKQENAAKAILAHPLDAFQCNSCGTHITASADSSPFCVTCGSADVETNTEQHLPLPSVTDASLIAVHCSSCDSHNTIDKSYVKASSELHCSVCGSELKLPVITAGRNMFDSSDISVEPLNADTDLLDNVQATVESENPMKVQATSDFDWPFDTTADATETENEEIEAAADDDFIFALPEGMEEIEAGVEDGENLEQHQHEDQEHLNKMHALERKQAQERDQLQKQISSYAIEAAEDSFIFALPEGMEDIEASVDCDEETENEEIEAAADDDFIFALPEGMEEIEAGVEDDDESSESDDVSDDEVARELEDADGASGISDDDDDVNLASNSDAVSGDDICLDDSDESSEPESENEKVEETIEDEDSTHDTIADAMDMDDSEEDLTFAVIANKIVAFKGCNSIAVLTNKIQASSDLDFESGAYQRAASRVVAKSGMRKGLNQLGFRMLTVPVVTQAAVNKKAREIKLEASMQEKANKRILAESLALSAAGLARDFWKGYKNPLRASVETELARVGVRNPQRVAAALFEKSSVEYTRNLVEVAAKLQAMSVQTREDMRASLDMTQEPEEIESDFDSDESSDGISDELQSVESRLMTTASATPALLRPQRGISGRMVTAAAKTSSAVEAAQAILAGNAPLRFSSSM
jgi:ribosomal protein S27E